MMKKLSVLLAALILVLTARADEGMWLLMHLKKMNYEDMQKKGLQLTPEEIYDINKPGVKDAIVSLGGFCTGEIISSQGLMLTNHHCAYDAIQSFSSVEHDYLTDGFWAKTMTDELNVPGLTASFLVRMEDVTVKVLGAVGNLTGNERNSAINKKIDDLKREAIKGTQYKAEIKPFFDGNEYYLFIYEIYTDIRLVGAPPSSIGKFGGDTDNWMWPRHTGDFSLLRVYSGPDGKPAAYSTSNIPLKPRHHLPVSLKGVQKNDFSMIMGFPGSTDRFLTSFGVRQAIEIEQPARVKIRGTRLEIMKRDMDASDKVRIQYASNYAQISNYWKYFIGQTRGLKRLRVYEKKQAEEAAFRKWAEAESDRKATYGNVLTDIENAYKELEKYVIPEVYFGEAVFGMEINMLYIKLFPVYSAVMAKKTPEEIAKAVEGVKADVDEYFKNHTASTDIKTMTALLEMYYKEVPVEFHPKELTEIYKKSKGNLKVWVEKFYAKSVLTDQARLNAFLKKPAISGFKNDPGFNLMFGFIEVYREFSAKSTAASDKMTEATRLFVDGMRKMMTDKKFYPNANSTIRFTYGQVLDYFPQDAVHYNYFTTLDGIMEKEDPTNDEFVVPAKLRELWKNKDYGQYAENGVLKVGFITNNDITGGNSGSPVINGKGELIGCAFDGNWEAMSGDIAFEPNLQRTICVDIRYILFIIDKYAGATRLIEEMTLVK
jgi:hypothetical protein